MPVKLPLELCKECGHRPGALEYLSASMRKHLIDSTDEKRPHTLDENGNLLYKGFTISFTGYKPTQASLSIAAQLTASIPSGECVFFYTSVQSKECGVHPYTPGEHFIVDDQYSYTLVEFESLDMESLLKLLYTDIDSATSRMKDRIDIFWRDCRDTLQKES